ncbi:cytosolic beta-glucosidase [Echinops telfairi]|uniref:Cytosolic beta-glucosidase n=1 Tax=Echinops telfairi TaxID=9371 RepID=A0ABM0ZRA5_ECHTE|nr:cytosolic beta-glucosidase [Echinops telfairi]
MTDLDKPNPTLKQLRRSSEKTSGENEDREEMGMDRGGSVHVKFVHREWWMGIVQRCLQKGGTGSGGWDADGKGPSVWDTFTHQGGERVFKNQTGDVACGSYTLWEEDLKCIKQLGLTHYRFSLSWSRLLPDGTTGFINQKGVAYYNKIIDDLIANGITPIVTLYHFDLPQSLEDQGGWLSEAIIDSFDKYAQFCFRTFGDRVKQWLTINEPSLLAVFAYDSGIFPPGVPRMGTGGYQAAHNLIKAHARSWHSYDSFFRKEQKGMVSIALFAGWLEPADPNSLADQEATQRAMAFHLDFFAKPIFIDGDYPEVVKSRVAAMSKRQGYPSSRLPEFTEEEKKMIKGTADFFAVQYYTSRIVKYKENKDGALGLLQDAEVEFFPDPSWECVDWVYIVPWGIRKLLKHIRDTYNNPAIYITENGFPQGDPMSLEDTQRWKYFRQTLQELFKAIQLDKVNLKMYCVWSLLDNFEWTQGYNSRFGLFHVDFEDPARPRVPYGSAKEYAKVIRNNGLEGHL